MQGDEQQEGIIQLSVKEIFEHIRLNSDRVCTVYVSYLEIYDEQVFDLLGQGHADLQNVTCRQARGPEDVFDCLAVGEMQRHGAEDSAMQHSCKSHAILVLDMECQSAFGAPGRGAVKKSTLSFVDLAGSESLSSRHDVDASLLSLSRAVDSLANRSRSSRPLRVAHTPEPPESKLTHILQETFEGKAQIALICTISPAPFCYNETKRTLEFASRVSRVRQSPVPRIEDLDVEVNHPRLAYRSTKQAAFVEAAQEPSRSKRHRVSQGMSMEALCRGDAFSRSKQCTTQKNEEREPSCSRGSLYSEHERCTAFNASNFASQGPQKWRREPHACAQGSNFGAQLAPSTFEATPPRRPRQKSSGSKHLAHEAVQGKVDSSTLELASELLKRLSSSGCHAGDACQDLLDKAKQAANSVVEHPENTILAPTPTSPRALGPVPRMHRSPAPRSTEDQPMLALPAPPSPSSCRVSPPASRRRPLSHGSAEQATKAAKAACADAEARRARIRQMQEELEQRKNAYQAQLNAKGKAEVEKEKPPKRTTNDEELKRLRAEGEARLAELRQKREKKAMQRRAEVSSTVVGHGTHQSEGEAALAELRQSMQRHSEQGQRARERSQAKQQALHPERCTAASPSRSRSPRCIPGLTNQRSFSLTEREVAHDIREERSDQQRQANDEETEVEDDEERDIKEKRNWRDDGLSPEQFRKLAACIAEKEDMMRKHRASRQSDSEASIAPQDQECPLDHLGSKHGQYQEAPIPQDSRAEASDTPRDAPSDRDKLEDMLEKQAQELDRTKAELAKAQARVFSEQMPVRMPEKAAPSLDISEEPDRAEGEVREHLGSFDSFEETATAVGGASRLPHLTERINSQPQQPAAAAASRFRASSAGNGSRLSFPGESESEAPAAALRLGSSRLGGSARVSEAPAAALRLGSARLGGFSRASSVQHKTHDRGFSAGRLSSGNRMSIGRDAGRLGAGRLGRPGSRDGQSCQQM
eukprot:TRINITY_DN5972_c0_g1_i2.p1 TRINITY_DN5972_c0_g1~~TRINITY_DN5972_c0_g1_i2.p1  ORF type:complete len:1090 (-),score=218.89 TRINITY_DN5972_c0_g1_i2:291-3248(-)